MSYCRQELQNFYGMDPQGLQNFCAMGHQGLQNFWGMDDRVLQTSFGMGHQELQNFCCMGHHWPSGLAEYLRQGFGRGCIISAEWVIRGCRMSVAEVIFLY